jgi:beta-N-acetylhexosaminidase
MYVSPDPAARRRLTALAAAAGAALLVGLVVGAGAGNGNGDGSGGEAPDLATTPSEERRDQALRAVDRLSLRQQVGQLTISSFDGTARPDYIRRRLRARETAGVILFGRNGGSAGHWRELTRSLQGPARGRALVMVDQEGGDIRTVDHVGPPASQPLQGEPANVRRAARSAGRGLRSAGVNVNLAPVADVPGPRSVMASRAFAGDPAGIGRRVQASVRGLGDARVAATAKHFPGLGDSAVNTDDAPATIPGGVSEDLVPFRAAVDAGVPLVMLSHALHPSLDGRAIASQSRAIVTGLLRERLGFDGVIVTDSMEAQAVVSRSDVATAAERSIRAGADLVLMTGSASWNLVFPRLLARARSSPAFRERVRQSAARVLELKSSLLG